jgi:DNA repair protein RadC
MGAAGMVLTHNHPSGICSPSIKDEELTRRIKHFGKLIEMPVLDHLIITDNGYFSFSDNGLLK